MLKLLSTSCLLLALLGCYSNPVTGKKEIALISEAQEIALGDEVYLQMQQAQGGAYLVDQELQKYVEKVGHAIARESDRPDLPYSFVIVNDSVPNAWALPGGKIAIHRGLLTELKSEAELAAVLAHEIVHSAARHSAKGMERGILMQSALIGLQQLLKHHKYEELGISSAAITAGLVSLKYSRMAELEADHYGIKYMVKAGYDPQAAVSLQETFLRLSEDKNPSWLAGLFASHPPSCERIEENKKTTALYPEGGKIGKEEYQKKIRSLLEKQDAYDRLAEGYAFLQEHRYRDALHSAKYAIAMEPNEAHFYLLKAKAERKLHLLEDARASLDKGIEVNDEFFALYLARGLLFLSQKDLPSSRKDLEKSLSLLATSTAHLALGEIELSEGHPELAQEHFRLAQSH